MKKYPIGDPDVAAAFDAFPSAIRQPLLQLRALILKIGYKLDPIGKVSESLKWGEPSYSTIFGSPVRLGWKQTAPPQLALYFHCQSKLVETFRELYSETLSCEGNRAILLRVDAPFPEKELCHCIELALNYHRIKKQPRLGASSSAKPQS